jgi:hypothetical protein
MTQKKSNDQCPYKVGDIIRYRVGRDSIDTSHACSKALCMANGLGVTLNQRHGRRHFYINSTSVGAAFTINGHRVTGSFDNKTHLPIRKHDKVFRKARDSGHTVAGANWMACQAISVFWAQLIIHTVKKIPPKISTERKVQINAARRKRYSDQIAGNCDG